MKNLIAENGAAISLAEGGKVIKLVRPFGPLHVDYAQTRLRHVKEELVREASIHGIGIPNTTVLAHKTGWGTPDRRLPWAPSQTAKVLADVREKVTTGAVSVSEFSHKLRSVCLAAYNDEDKRNRGSWTWGVGDAVKALVALRGRGDDVRGRRACWTF